MTRVLVVDDEPQMLRALHDNLRGARYNVDLAATGEAALARAARDHPDLVLLDLGLPGMDGVEVIRGLRGWTDVPVVVLSARHEEPSRSRRSTPEPTTTSRSRSGWTSCSPGWGRAAPRGAGQEALVETDVHHRPRRKADPRDGARPPDPDRVGDPRGPRSQPGGGS